MKSTPSLLLLPGRLWPWMVEPIMVQSMEEINLFKTILFVIGRYAKTKTKKKLRNKYAKYCHGYGPFQSRVQLFWIKYFSFSRTGYRSKTKDSNLSCCLHRPEVRKRRDEFMDFPKALTPNKTQIVSFRIWNRFSDFISYGNSTYTTLSSFRNIEQLHN